MSLCAISRRPCTYRVARVDRRPYASIQSISAPNITALGSQLAALVIWKISVLGAGVWVGAQVDPLLIFVGVVSELGWG